MARIGVLAAALRAATAVASAALCACAAEPSGGSEDGLMMSADAPAIATQGGAAAGASAGAAGSALPPTAGVGVGTSGTLAPPPAGVGAAGAAGSQAGTGGMLAACATGELDSDRDGSPDCDDACPQDMAKAEPGLCGCGKPEPALAGAACAAMPVVPDGELCVVAPITDQLREIHGQVYTRYASANGVPILATDSPQDEALRRTCMLVRDLGQRPDILQTMLDENIGLVVMGVDETSADFPEFAAWGVPDSRARGLGGVPRGLCAEENIMCDRSKDRWRGESICVHEFAHTMHLGVYNVMESDFDDRVTAAYQAAKSAGKFANTYAASNAVEYFGEGVQDWYDTNLESIPSNGVHNEINTRAELEAYDPGLYAILSEVLPDEPGYEDCYSYE